MAQTHLSLFLSKTRVMLAALVLFAVSAVLVSPGPAQGRKGAKALQEYVHPLKGPVEGRPLLFVGDEADKFVKLEPEGLRITLPAGFDGERPTHGVNTAMVASGDFEISAAFEVLKEPGPGEAGSKGTKVHLLVTVDKPPWDLAGFSRHLMPKFATRYTAWHNQWNQDTRKNKQEIKWFEAKSTKWRFRLTRKDTVLSYYLAEADEADFRLLQQYLFVGDDVKDIRVVATTGGPKAALDVRVTDLRIRAESLPNLGVVPTDGMVPAEPPEERPIRGRWLIWLALGLAVVVLVGVTFAVWHRRRAQGASVSDPRGESSAFDVAVRCTKCGANLRVKAGLAGKRVKCPQCGQAVQLPA